MADRLSSPPPVSDGHCTEPLTSPTPSTVLDGVTAYVEVRTTNDNRSSAFQRVLQAMGARVENSFTNDVTHVVFKDGTKRTRDKAAKRGVHLVSVLWVDSCRQHQMKVDEKEFPANTQRCATPPPGVRNKKYKSMQPRDFEEEVARSAERCKKRQKRNKYRQLLHGGAHPPPASSSSLHSPGHVLVVDTQPRSPLSMMHFVDLESPLVIPSTPPSMQRRLQQLQRQKARDSEKAEAREGLDDLQKNLFREEEEEEEEEDNRSTSVNHSLEHTGRHTDKHSEKDRHTETEDDGVCSAVTENERHEHTDRRTDIDGLTHTDRHTDIDGLKHTNRRTDIDGLTHTDKHTDINGLAHTERHTDRSDAEWNSKQKGRRKTRQSLPGTNPPQHSNGRPRRKSAAASSQSALGTGRGSQGDPSSQVLLQLSSQLSSQVSSQVTLSSQSASDNSQSQAPKRRKLLNPSQDFQLPSPPPPPHLPPPPPPPSTKSGGTKSKKRKTCDIDDIFPPICAAKRQQTNHSHGSDSDNAGTSLQSVKENYSDNKQTVTKSCNSSSRSSSSSSSSRKRVASAVEENSSDRNVSASQQTVTEGRRSSRRVSCSQPVNGNGRNSKGLSAGRLVNDSGKDSREDSHLHTSLGSSVMGSSGALGESMSVGWNSSSVAGASCSMLGPVSRPPRTSLAEFKPPRPSKRGRRQTTQPGTGRQSTQPGTQRSVSGHGWRDSQSTMSLQKFRLTGMPSLVMTSLHRQEQEEVVSAVQKLGVFRVEDRVSRHTTHVVCGEGRRTLNVLNALARGLWIVSKHWVKQSVEEGRWVGEEDFEMTQHFFKCKEARLAREAEMPGCYQSTMFQSEGSMFVSHECTPPRSQLVKLLILCGAKVTDSLSRADFYIGDKVHDDKNSIKPVWVLDCVSQQELLPMDDYVMAINHKAKVSSSPEF